MSQSFPPAQLGQVPTKYVHLKEAINIESHFANLKSYFRITENKFVSVLSCKINFKINFEDDEAFELFFDG